MIELFYRVFQHLLPRSKTWKLKLSKRLGQLFAGLSYLPDDLRNYADDVYFDIFPQTTRELAEWEEEWGLVAGNLTEQQRRDRIQGLWSFLGGQSPRYIEETLQVAGFDVYVHEWWDEITDLTRNPFVYLRDSTGRRTFFIVCSDDYGVSEGVCGNANAICGYSADPIGYPLVNKILTAYIGYICCLQANAVCGNANAVCGANNGFKYGRKSYIIPTDPDYWPYFVYIAGETFADAAEVEADRRDEFETLLMRICPTHQWIGVIVNYI